jgi:predicted nucleic acid-binding protein
MYLLDTNVISELRRPRPHGAVLDWIADVPADQLYISVVTGGEIQAGIEMTRERDAAKAEELEAWLDKVLASYGVLPMDAAAFREWARLMHRRSGAMTEDAMIAATAIVHRLTVVTSSESNLI